MAGLNYSSQTKLIMLLVKSIASWQWFVLGTNENERGGPYGGKMVLPRTKDKADVYLLKGKWTFLTSMFQKVLTLCFKSEHVKLVHDASWLISREGGPLHASPMVVTVQKKRCIHHQSEFDSPIWSYFAHVLQASNSIIWIVSSDWFVNEINNSPLLWHRQ